MAKAKVQSTTDFNDWMDNYDVWLDGDDEAEIAYALLDAVRSREGGSGPFTVTTNGDRTFIQDNDRTHGLTLVLSGRAALDTFCSMFEKRFLDGDAESHIGFLRAIHNPKS